VFTPEFEKHARILMRDKFDANEYYLIPLGSGYTTTLQQIEKQRRQNPKMPAYDVEKYEIVMSILPLGTVGPGKTFEGVYEETKGKTVVELPVSELFKS
jgi:hypothetical protein